MNVRFFYLLLLIISILTLLLSNAVTLSRDNSIFSVSIIILIYSSGLSYTSLYFTSLDSGIGLYGGLFHATSITHSFHVFIFLISTVILQLTAFYPRSVWTASYSSLNNMMFYNLLYYSTNIVNKMGEQFNIIEYPLILLFIVSGAIFLVSTRDLVSIFLLFIFIAHEWLSLANTLALIFFNLYMTFFFDGLYRNSS